MLNLHTKYNYVLNVNNKLTVTDEGVIILEKVGSLENSVQLKLAFICRQTGHHI